MHMLPGPFTVMQQGGSEGIWPCRVRNPPLFVRAIQLDRIMLARHFYMRLTVMVDKTLRIGPVPVLRNTCLLIGLKIFIPESHRAVITPNGLKVCKIRFCGVA